MLLTGAEILMECLLEQGADTIFGYPGGAVLPIYDTLYRYQDKIKHYLVSHEQNAAHAADGFARSTGRTGVCLATSGPGATNLVTGIATAYMDSSPIVAITGNVAISLLGKDSFQEVDITGITMPITKHNFIVKDIARLADTVRESFNIAKRGRPGPVLIDIPKDIQVQTCEYTPARPKPLEKLSGKLTPAAIEKAARLIEAANRPFILCGGGVVAAGATEELLAFSEIADAPVCATAMGLGGIPADSPFFTGIIGMHGTGVSNTLAGECDLLIALGTRFSDRVVSNVIEFAPHANILHIDIDAAEIDKNVVAYHSLIGDVQIALSMLIEAVTPQRHGDWLARMGELKIKYFRANNAVRDASGKPKPQYILECIAAKTNGEAIIVTEVGQHQMWACHHIPVKKPRRFITSGGLGTMGFGLGAAIGAAVANPGKTVVNIAGDGCFRMNHIELATAVENDLPIIVVVFNNHALGMVRQWQSLFFDKRYSSTNLKGKTTDFVKLAEAYGASAYFADTPEDVEYALTKALAQKKPAVINCEIGEDEKVFPMVPPGASIHQFVTG